jgi:hypothetical protein
MPNDLDLHSDATWEKALGEAKLAELRAFIKPEIAEMYLIQPGDAGGPIHAGEAPTDEEQVAYERMRLAHEFLEAFKDKLSPEAFLEVLILAGDQTLPFLEARAQA